MVDIPDRRGQEMTRKLEKITEDAVKKLLDETGHQLTLTDFEDIYKLNEIGRRIANPEEIEAWDLLNMPVWAGKVKLYRPSLGVILWISDVAAVWFASNPVLLDVSIAYACSRECIEDELRSFRDAREAKKAVKKWWRRCRCSYVEMEEALIKLLNLDDSGPVVEEKESISLDYGPVVATLIKEFGGSQADWVWNKPIDEVNSMVGCLVQTREATSYCEWRANVRANAKQPPPAPDWWMKKNRDFLEMNKGLRKKWQT